MTFPNENPVATGPFTEVRVFRNQVYELGRNPRYWQEGRPRIDGAPLPRLSGQRPRQPGPGLRRGGLGRELRPRHRPRLRRTQSGAPPLLVPAHREHHLPLRQHHPRPVRRRAGAQGAEHGDRPRAPGRRGALPLLAPGRRHGPERRLRRLARSRDRRRRTTGCATTWPAPRRSSTRRAIARGEDGVRRLPDGEPWRYEILTVSGWSDWVRASQVIARGLRRARHRRPRCAPTTSAPGSSACRRGTST